MSLKTKRNPPHDSKEEQSEKPEEIHVANLYKNNV